MPHSRPTVGNWPRPCWPRDSASTVLSALAGDALRHLHLQLELREVATRGDHHNELKYALTSLSGRSPSTGQGPR